MPGVLTVLRFDGPRFEDHGLDVDVLPEILAYKRLLQATAKEIWRREHPDRRRLPKGFDDNISLKFFEISPGSTSVPLVRKSAGQYRLFDDELVVAAQLLHWTIYSARSLADMPHLQDSPSDFRAARRILPSAVIPLFQHLGNALREDERIFVDIPDLEIPNHVGPACFDHRVKETILRFAAGKYQDVVEVSGEVRATDLDGQKFTLRLEDGSKLSVRLRPEDEQTVLQAFGEHSSVRVKVQGVGEFSPEDGALRQVAAVDQIELAKPGAAAQVKEPPIWERLAAIGKTVPDDVWDQVPKDFAANTDKYLYGEKDPH
jgi:hypothetical protein